MSVKVVIQARYGSSRLPGKPLLTLIDRPVIWHVIERCKEAGIKQSNIFVATDDQRISDALKGEDIQVVLTASVIVLMRLRRSWSGAMKPLSLMCKVMNL